jgi:hypothetical protein
MENKVMSEIKVYTYKGFTVVKFPKRKKGEYVFQATKVLMAENLEKLKEAIDEDFEEESINGELEI